MSQAIINTAKTVRSLVIHQVQSIPEEIFDIQPQGLPNTIRWNVGHIICSLDFFIAGHVPLNSNFPETYNSFFQTGTKPADWTSAPPTKEELLGYLTQQLASLSEISPGIMDQRLNAPFEMGPLRFETVGELFNFAFIHETIHFATISNAAKLIQRQG